MEEPKIEIIETREKFLRFKIKNITEGVANAIRRTLINDIPKLAIDKVIFRHGQIRDASGNTYDSSLPLFDEIVAHRIGLIPIKSDLGMNFREECQCGGKGCSLCTVSYNLNKTGPCEVVSGDLIVFAGNPELVPADKNIPIVKLGPNQALLISAEAYLGRGMEHAKFQATSGVSYKYHRTYTINKEIHGHVDEILNHGGKSIISSDDKNITVTDDYGNRELKKIINIINKESVDKNVEPPLMKEEKNTFVFKFETDGSLDPLDILKYALKRIPERFNELVETMSAQE
ncbi:DNA-directed RNA polymerase subunit D [Caldiplasma sukawensis]